MSPSSHGGRLVRSVVAAVGIRNVRALPVDTRDPLALAIQRAFRADLGSGAKLIYPASRDWAVAENVLDGYCAVGAAAYFFLGGGREAGLQPMQRTDPDNDTRHWWIRRADGRLVDVVVEPGSRMTFPYEEGGPRGFMNGGYKRPSKRARDLMDLVIASNPDLEPATRWWLTE